MSGDRNHFAFLDSAYRATTYAVELPSGRYAIRIGERHPVLDELATSFGAREWAYVTAWNPRSVQQTKERNEARNAMLESALDDLGTRWFRGTSEPDDGSAGEESLLAFIGRKEAESLGRRFDQNAIVVGEVGKEAELVWLR